MRDWRPFRFSFVGLLCAVCDDDSGGATPWGRVRLVRRFRGCRNKGGGLFCGAVTRRRCCGFPQSRVVIARVPNSTVDYSDADEVAQLSACASGGADAALLAAARGRL